MVTEEGIYIYSANYYILESKTHPNCPQRRVYLYFEGYSILGNRISPNQSQNKEYLYSEDYYYNFRIYY